MSVGRFFATTLTRVELVPANVTVSAGVAARLGTFVVPLGMMFAWGRGSDLGLEDTEGRILIDVRDAGVAPGLVLNGLLRLVANNPLGQEAHVYWEGRTEQCRLGATILRDRMILPAQDPVVPAGFSLSIVFVPDTGGVVGSANTVVLVDARRARQLGD